MVRRHAAALCIFAFLMAFSNAALALDLPRIHGFVEGAFGAKLRSGTTRHDVYNMAEQRLQLKSLYYPEWALLADMSTAINIKADLTVDEYFEGKTGVELREANIFFSPLSWADVKIGRQIFTWGTGDYLFVNDLFPKDYVSFFIGRDDEYLKKPSDGAKLSLYNKLANLDLIAIPFFEPNTIAKGSRLSFFDTFSGGISGEGTDRVLAERSTQIKNTEIAARLHRNFGSYETALYFYRGFYKNPRGYKNESIRQLFYPRLQVYGASARGPLFGGIANAEFGYYNSVEDSDGSNRLIENPGLKALAGYDYDLGDELKMGGQYQIEQILHYGRYKDNLLPPDFFRDEYRHLLTGRVEKQLLNQTLRVSLFAFYSLNDQDVYLRPLIEYDITDQTKLTMGGNLIWGNKDDTEFGQMERNSNLYTRLRYSF